jgi:hypothetical protein
MDPVFLTLIWSLSVLLLIGCVVLYALVRYVIPKLRARARGADRGVRPSRSPSGPQRQ